MRIFAHIVVFLGLFLADLIATEARAQGVAPAPVQPASQQERQTGLPKETQAMLDRLRQ